MTDSKTTTKQTQVLFKTRALIAERLLQYIQASTPLPFSEAARLYADVINGNFDDLQAGVIPAFPPEIPKPNQR